MLRFLAIFFLMNIISFYISVIWSKKLNSRFSYNFYIGYYAFKFYFNGYNARWGYYYNAERKVHYFYILFGIVLMVTNAEDQIYNTLDKLRKFKKMQKEIGEELIVNGGELSENGNFKRNTNWNINNKGNGVSHVD